MRRLRPNQVRDPGRGSFIVHAAVKEPKPTGAIIVAPVGPSGEQYSNTIVFEYQQHSQPEH